MNFGDKLKRIRTEKNLTQPQFAASLGIEQSYLSKLENDKSVPSADMFNTIVEALGLAPEALLADIDKQVLRDTLRHIPAVGRYLEHGVTRRVHHARRYLLAAAAAGALGFALMLAANDGIFFPNNLYKYQSAGVILPGESDNVFEQFTATARLKRDANLLSGEQYASLLSAFQAQRLRQETVEFWGNRGTVFFQAAGAGRRKFELAGVRMLRSEPNKLLQYLGALFAFCGVLTVFVEWRLRTVRAREQDSDSGRHSNLPSH